jgi:hypothetical protein
MIFKIKRIDYKELNCIPLLVFAPSFARTNNEYLVIGPNSPALINPDQRATILDILGYKYE